MPAGGGVGGSVGGGVGGGAVWFDKVPLRFQGYTEAQFREGGLSRGANRDGAHGRVHRPQRHPDAVLREHRRLRGRGDDGRHVGHRRIVRADRQARAPLGWGGHRPGARAAAGQSHDHRRRLFHRRPLRNRRGRHRRGAFGRLDGGVHRAEHEDLRPRQWTGALRACAVRIRGGAWEPALERWHALVVVRGHREARRRGHTREDLDQRAAANRERRDARSRQAPGRVPFDDTGRRRVPRPRCVSAIGRGICLRARRSRGRR